MRAPTREPELPTLHDERPYDVLAGIDDLELAAPKLAGEPLAPMPMGNAKLPPVKKRRTWNSENDGETISKVGAAYYLLVVIGLAALAIAKDPVAAVIFAFYLLLALPHLVVYLIALWRIARYGNPGLALLCFLLSCLGVGEIVALVVAYEDPDKWRLGRLYRIWATLFGLVTGIGIAAVLVALLVPAVMMGRVAAQKAREHNAAREQGLPTADSKATGAPAPIPSASPPGQPPANGVVPKEQRPRQNPGVASVAGSRGDMSGGPAVPRSAPAGGAGRPNDRPPATTPAEQITRALEDLRGGTIFARREAVKQLRKIDVDPDRQAEVAKTLTDLLIDNDHWLKEDAAAALETWAVAGSVTPLVRFLQDAGLGDANAKRYAMRALARLRDPSAAKAITQQLFTRDAPAAIQALKEMGPAAEPAVIALLDHQDPAIRREMCGVLEEIGTANSIPELRRCAGDRVAGVKEAARSAILAISARQKAGAGSDDAENKPGRRKPSRRSASEMLERVPK